MLPREQLVPLITGATVFVVPSVYEPLGIVNLEAAACGTAVVASDVGGIPEVVDDGRTGLLVHYDPDDPAAFEAGLAARIAELLADPARAAAMGAAGRERVLAEFGWPAIAQQTVEVYTAVLGAARPDPRRLVASSRRPPAGDGAAAKSGANPALSRNCEGHPSWPEPDRLPCVMSPTLAVRVAHGAGAAPARGRCLPPLLEASRVPHHPPLAEQPPSRRCCSRCCSPSPPAAAPAPSQRGERVLDAGRGAVPGHRHRRQRPGHPRRAKPESIVSMSATATEMLFAIDAGNQVKAVDSDLELPRATAPTTEALGLHPQRRGDRRLQARPRRAQ